MARIPKLCLHKRSGLGYATDPFTGKESYFGPFGSPECRDAYDRWVIQLLSRRAEVRSGAPPGSAVSVADLVGDYMAHAEAYYRKHGRPTTEAGTLRQVLRVVNRLAGELDADAFGPAELKAVRAELVRQGLARDHVNKQVGRVRRVWRWAVEHGLARAGTLQALAAVAPLALGRSAARESEPVGPVPEDVFWATVFHLDGETGAMARLQLYGALRAEDLVVMRPRDLDTSRDLWLYTPWTHKTEHLGRGRRVWLGPRAQGLLGWRLDGADPDAWLWPSGARGRHAAYRGHLTVGGYRQRILKCCNRYGLPRWFPLQVRHLALTLVREAHGLEAAQVAAGHSEADVTQIYAARDDALARKVAAEMG